MESNGIWDGKVTSVDVPPERAIDIDSRLDYEIARFLKEENISKVFKGKYDEEKFQLRDKTVIITGGAGRIGSATARACLSLGANVVITDISSSRLKQFENNLPKDQLGRAHTLTGNITEESNIVELIKKAVKIAGPINAAVHSAYPVSKGWGSVYEGSGSR